MEENLFTIPLFIYEKRISISVVPTDTKDDIYSKIIYNINKKFPIFASFLKNFNWITFLGRKENQNFLDLTTIPLFYIENNDNAKLRINFNLLNEIEKHYQISLNEQGLEPNKNQLFSFLLYIMFLSIPDIRNKKPKKKN